MLVIATLFATPAPSLAAPLRLMALGDSLTAGFGLPADQGFTVKLQAALRAKGFDVTVLNAGVSGDTSAGGLARLDWALADKPDAALLELGANDMLRGLDPGAAKENLSKILTRLQSDHIKTLLCGMMSVDNWGPDYTKNFDAIYPALAQQYHLALYPFFLDGVALNPSLIQADGLHPNAAGVDVIVARILPAVTTLLTGLGQPK
jgi:acyl-CoA thioesterase-1